MMTRKHLALAPPPSLVLLFVLPFASLVGCNRGPELVPVDGVVTFKGKPLEYGAVMFQPVGIENGMVARSQISSDGTFTLATEAGRGALAGKYWVGVTAFEAQRSQAQGTPQQELALGRSAVPTHFNRAGSSGIEIEIAPNMELPLTIDLDQYK